MNNKIKTAVFPVAGLGSRFLPATKVTPKEMLPIVDKPLIQYAVEEAVSAGINTLIFVTGRNKRAIEDHFDNNQELEHFLRSRGKVREADLVRNTLPEGVECIFVRQAEQLGLGHAVLCAERVVAGEPFAVLLADDFLRCDNGGVLKNLKERYQKTGKAQISVMEINGPDISNYGVVVPGSKGQSMVGLIEKPALKEKPSNLASIGRYVLTPEIFDVLRNQRPGKGGEIQLADAINVMAEHQMVEANETQCLRFDCGSINGYLKAILNVSKERGLD